MPGLRYLHRISTSKITLAVFVPLLALAIAAAVGLSVTAAAPPGHAAKPATAALAHRIAAGERSAETAVLTAEITGKPVPGHPRHHHKRHGHGHGRKHGRHGRRHHIHRGNLSPQGIAWQMLPYYGWTPRYQFRYLRWLWAAESGWRVHAQNPYSGAYGIPQALPGSKMASAGADWQNSARTQIRWGLRYIRAVYGSPERAWQHEQGYGWY